MKNIDLICVGYLKNDQLKNVEKNLLKKINNKYRLNIIEVDDEKNQNISRNQEIEKVKKTEGERILSKIKKGSFVITFEINGDSSVENLGQMIESLPNENISIIVGGSLGLANEVSKISNKKVSISNMTFPHQLMRIIILEQFSVI